ncbi:MAG: hypothetical protein LN412_01770 [Candidatus Thermoplasmatota archaeon]|nr:hypothetical protein [Candidatus Thermoplasmatota archaeon]
MVGCPTCGAELTYIPPYERHYCYGCRSYAAKTLHACKECDRALVFVKEHHKYYCYGCQEYKEDVEVGNPCPTCGEELQHISQYDRLFCFQCRVYAPKEHAIVRRSRGGQAVTERGGDHEQAIGYAPFSREEMDLASKEILMNWCREYGLDDSGLKYELRLRLLEHVRKQNLLLKGEEVALGVPEEAASTDVREEIPEEAVVVERHGQREQPAQEALAPEIEVFDETDSTPQATTTPCPTCAQELTYIPQYNRWYCYSCQRYAQDEGATSTPVYPLQRERQERAVSGVKLRGEKRGNPMVGVSLAILGLLMYIADELLFNAPAIFDIPVFIRAAEIDFALRFLSTVFIVLGIIAAILLVRPRR